MKSLQAFLALFALSARGMNTPLLLIASLLSIGLLGSCVTPGSFGEEPGHLTADQQFAKVKSLVGDWYRTDGAPTDGAYATYRMVAKDSALEERIFPGTEREMVTMYFVDKDRLKLTHFCNLGNQPTMEAKPGNADLLEFGFLGATNLKSPEARHMHEHSFSFLGKNRIDTTWIFWDGGKEADGRHYSLVRR
ncbi:MAG: hypothetical protein QF437_27075 [Planctomycetota bacterium]|jgi:hypothetical protein|nr:hypothetical protein [Roseibacillus sp.]MDP7134191.1 hypothetical protein [Planctomycetota bacterium]